MTAVADAPNVASAVNIGAFNLGDAFGAALGGGVIAARLGYPAVALVGAATSAAGQERSTSGCTGGTKSPVGGVRLQNIGGNAPAPAPVTSWQINVVHLFLSGVIGVDHDRRKS